MQLKFVVIFIVCLLTSCIGTAKVGIDPEDIEKFDYIYDSYYPVEKSRSRSEIVKSYVGTEKCATCHNSQYRTWRKSYMSRFVRLRKDIRYVPMLPGRYGDQRDDVAILVGGRRKLAVVVRPWNVVPYQYDKYGGKKRRKKPGWKYRPEWSFADYRSGCGRCHLTGLDLVTLEFSELGVGCEACHGPGKAHVDNSGKKTIFVPNGSEACERCHFMRTKHRAKFRFSGKFHR